MNLRNLLIVLLLAAFSFGGTFTCTSSSDSDKHTENPTTPAK